MKAIDDQGHARHVGAVRAADLAAAVRARRRTSSARPYDVDAAKKLLAEAGYPNGFEVTMDCPNDRYVNDEAICQAVAAMLARIGVKVQLQSRSRRRSTSPRSLASGGYDTSFYLLGWTPGLVRLLERDRQHHRLPRRRRERRQLQLGGYCNPKSKSSPTKSWSRPTPAKRDAMIPRRSAIKHEEAGMMPLHQQALAWGVSKKSRSCSGRTTRSCSTG